MSYKVQFQQGNSSMWQPGGTGYGSEWEAITQAKQVARRSGVTAVRVLSPNGVPVWFN